MLSSKQLVADRVYLGRYQSTAFLGEGGMSNVWLAQDVKDSRFVVVKVMKKQFFSDPKCREAFRREIDFLSRFQHPYAVTFYEASLHDQHGPCLAMEFVQGVPLNEILQRQGRLTPERVGKLLGKLCAMLHALHAEGYIHRDLKPANLMVVCADTRAESLKVIDFGLARKLVGATETPYIPIERISGYSSGTPDYMSPEQLGDNPMDQCGDLYSVGVILYELLTGARPFTSESVAETLLAHAEQAPPPFPPEVRVPPAIEQVVMACLAKHPEDRPQSARDLALLYGQALGQPIWDEEESEELRAAASVAREDGLGSAHDEPLSTAVEYNLEAWMPEQIAEMKLKGFLHDLGGEVTESVPGMIRVYLKREQGGAQPASNGGFLSWLGLAKKPEAGPEPDLIEMEAHMKKNLAGRANELYITLRLRVVQGRQRADWNAWCDQTVRALSAYLMAKRV
jgi:serine/threonine-protein kinase